MLNTMLAVIQGQDLIQAVIVLIVVGAIFGLLYWAVRRVALPEPFDKVADVVLVVIAVVVLINLLLSLIGKPFIVW